MTITYYGQRLATSSAVPFRMLSKIPSLSMKLRILFVVALFNVCYGFCTLQYRSCSLATSLTSSSQARRTNDRHQQLLQYSAVDRRVNELDFDYSSTWRIDSSSSLSRRQALERGVAVATSTTGGLWLPSSPAHAANAVVPTIRLGSGSLEVSRTIQGYWQLAGGHGRYQEADAIANMAAHFKAGITTLDTADIYGPSELIVGRFVKSQPQAIPITKFCCFRFLDEITRDEVKERIQKACERLQVSKLPLVQFFWSQYDVKRYVDVALWLAELKEQGLIQEIGATNFDLKRLQELHNAGVPLVSHQVQCSAMDRRPVQSGMAQWCAENNISLIAFGTVASGILSNLYLGKGPPSQAERNTASMRLYSSTAARFGDWQLVQELLQTMNAIAADVRKDGRCPEANISNIAQRYVLETPAVASVLIGVRNQEHIAENVRTHAFQLNQDERDAIDKVVAKREGPKGDVWDIERGLISG